MGLAIVLALVVGLASTALAHTNVDNKLFHLNHNNVTTTLTKLTGNLAGAVLKLDNNGTGPALSLEAGTNRAPLTVNAAAGTATGLSADELDGKNSTQFANSSHAHAGEAITSGTVADARIAGTVARDNEVIPRCSQVTGRVAPSMPTS